MLGESLAVVYGLASAASWGVADFCGGVTSKRHHALSVALVGQIIGTIFFVLCALLMGEPFALQPSLWWAVAAGVGGGSGVALFYYSLAQGRMALTAPVTALVMTLLPVLVAFALEGFPNTTTLIGLVLAPPAVWLLSGSGRSKIQWEELVLPLIAGAGFALFLVGLNQASETGGVWWPLVVARIASMGILSVVLLQRQVRLQWGQGLGDVTLLLIIGLGDALGNLFFVLAAQTGRLDIAAVLSSLAPAGTVLLAWGVLRERINPVQWIGIGLAVLALILIAL